MSNRIGPGEIRNSVLLSIFFFGSFLLIALLAFLLNGKIQNDVILSEAEETFEEIPDTTTGDDQAVIQVANGTNFDDRAGEVSRLLQQRDFLTLNPINADRTNTSTIFYSTAGNGRLTEANTIGAILGIEDIQPIAPEEITANFDSEADIQIIIGRDTNL